MGSVFLIEYSHDGGATWRMQQAYGMYKNRDRAEARAVRQRKYYAQFGEEHLSGVGIY